MSRYAEGTRVDPAKSRAEIERILSRYGATAFGYAYEGARAIIFFRARDRHIKFVVPLPSREIIAKHAKRRMTPAQLNEAVDRETRRLWRSLAMAIKAKLEIVESGITTLEDEFLPYTVLPSGETVAEAIRPQMDLAYRDGKMPPLLGYMGDDR